MHTAAYKVDVASDRRRHENVPRHIPFYAGSEKKSSRKEVRSNKLGSFFSLEKLFMRVAHVTKNVPWHILAPAAVACDIYLIRRSAHPRGAVFTLQESNFL